MIILLWLSPCVCLAQKGKGSKLDVNNIDLKLNEIASEYSNELTKFDQYNFVDSLNFWERLQEESNGQFNFDYAYGLNTAFRDSSRMIGSYFNAYGGLNSQIMSIPIKVAYNYSSLKIPLGTNNYFRISYDRQKMLQNSEKMRLEKLANYNEQLKNTESQLGKLSELQSYLDVYINANKEKYAALLKEKLLLSTPIDSLKTNYEENLINYRDSLNSIYGNISPPNFQVDTAAQIDKFKNAKEKRFMEEYKKILSLYNKVTSFQQKYQHLQSKLDNTKSSLSTNTNKVSDLTLDHSKKINWLDAVKKVDLGLTYSNTTGLSNQSTAVKGIGAELQMNNYYLSVSSGLTLNNIMLSTNEMSNQLLYNQNVFNQFDFQRISRKGLLSTVKTGYGTPTTTHFFVGFNHITNTRLGGSDSMSIHPAVGMELDIRLAPKFLKNGALDLVYAKTSINRNIDSSSLSMANSLFSSYKSNAYLVKYTQNISRLNSSFALSYRHIDENVNTMLYGFMQPGNRRLSFESRHKIASFLKVGTNYRFEQSLSDISGITLNNFGLTTNGALGKNVTYAANLTTVKSDIQQLNVRQTNWNYLINSSVQFYNTWNHIRGMASINYNDFLLYDSVSLSRFSQFGINAMLQQSTWSTAVGYDYFFQSSTLVNEGTHMLSIKGTWRNKRGSIDAGIKYAIREAATSLGGHLTVNFEINRFMDITISAEKFVLGNFYRNYYRNAYNQFPYLIRTGLKLKL